MSCRRWTLFFSYFLILFLCCAVLIRNEEISSTGKDVDKLILTQIVFRHGDRSPTANFKTNPVKEYDWPQGFGQLSEKGMIQLFQLGQFFRSRYIIGEQNLKILSELYNRTEIHIQSTDYDRTLMSAYCNLAGLYPPKGQQVWNRNITWQPIPVHTVPKDMDDLLYTDAKCPKYDEVYQKVLHSEEIMKEEQDNKDFYLYIDNVTGEVHAGIYKVWKIYDPIYCESNHNFTLPPWVNKTFRNKTVFQKLKELNALSFVVQYNKDPIEARLRGGNLLGRMIQHMKNKSANWTVEKEKEKAFIYSAHDSTVAAFLSAAKVFNNLTPTYASAVLVELYESVDKQYFVKMFYHNDTNHMGTLYSLQVPGCSDRCSLEEFERLVNDNIPTDWHLECQVSKFDDNSLLIGVGLALVALLLVIIISYNVLHHRRTRIYHKYSNLPVSDD